MKPFNLDEYLKDPSRKVVTRDGRDVRIICTDRKGDCPIVALIKNSNGNSEFVASYSKDGLTNEYASALYDLFFDPKTFQPFDKVLARCTESVWVPTLFGYFIDEADKDPLSPFENGERVVCVDIGYQQCIPYNDETKHLVGTLDDCPEYYKWWEE